MVKKMKFKKYFKTALLLFFSTLIFFGLSYFYLSSSLERNKKQTEKNEEHISYYEDIENCGIKVSLPGEINLLIYLDFTKEISYIIYIDNNMGDYFGYSEDYKITFDYQTLSLFIDRFGGIDMPADYEMQRYTGVQICDMLQQDKSKEFIYDLLDAQFKKISQIGISNEDFVFLIKNTSTNLTVPVCFYWPEHMQNMFSNATFVNWEF